MSDSAIPETVAHQAPLSREFSRQEYWSGLPFPSPGDLPNQGSNPDLLYCRQILYHLSHQGRPVVALTNYYKLGDLIQQNLLSHSSEGQKFNISLTEPKSRYKQGCSPPRLWGRIRSLTLTAFSNRWHSSAEATLPQSLLLSPVCVRSPSASFLKGHWQLDLGPLDNPG